MVGAKCRKAIGLNSGSVSRQLPSPFPSVGGPRPYWQSEYLRNWDLQKINVRISRTEMLSNRGSYIGQAIFDVRILPRLSSMRHLVQQDLVKKRESIYVPKVSPSNYRTVPCPRTNLPQTPVCFLDNFDDRSSDVGSFDLVASLKILVLDPINEPRTQLDLCRHVVKVPCGFSRFRVRPHCFPLGIVGNG